MAQWLRWLDPTWSKSRGSLKNTPVSCVHVSNPKENGVEGTAEWPRPSPRGKTNNKK